MKKYRIVKVDYGYAITTNKSIEEYKKTGLLPYETAFKQKKYLLERINKDIKYKNNVDFETYFIN